MADTNESGWFWDKTAEPRDDKIERLARECEKKTLLLKLKKCKTLKDFKALVCELEKTME